jgi:hypothetical protein
VKSVAARLHELLASGVTLSEILGGKAKTAEAIDGFEWLQGVENALLIEEGFEPTESNLLWLKESVCYGREAALQVARSRSYGGNPPLP